MLMVDEAVAFMHHHRGYLVAPSVTCFTRLCEDEPYRGAMLSTDLAIADSGLRAAEDIHFCSQ